MHMYVQSPALFGNEHKTSIQLKKRMKRNQSNFLFPFYQPAPLFTRNSIASSLAEGLGMPV